MKSWFKTLKQKSLPNTGSQTAIENNWLEHIIGVFSSTSNNEEKWHVVFLHSTFSHIHTWKVFFTLWDLSFWWYSLLFSVNAYESDNCLESSPDYQIRSSNSLERKLMILITSVWKRGTLFHLVLYYIQMLSI